MASFKGTYQHILDPKNRFNLPSRMRAGFVPEDKETVVLTRGYEACIYIYPFSEWIKLEDQLRKLSVMDANARKLIRFISGYAHECEIDKQGRVIIPQTLLDFAKIEKEIAIIGMLNWVEAWNPKSYEEAHAGFDLEKTADQLVKF